MQKNILMRTLSVLLIMAILLYYAPVYALAASEVNAVDTESNGKTEKYLVSLVGNDTQTHGYYTIAIRAVAPNGQTDSTDNQPVWVMGETIPTRVPMPSGYGTINLSSWGNESSVSLYVGDSPNTSSSPDSQHILQLPAASNVNRAEMVDPNYAMQKMTNAQAIEGGRELVDVPITTLETANNAYLTAKSIQFVAQGRSSVSSGGWIKKVVTTAQAIKDEELVYEDDDISTIFPVVEWATRSLSFVTVGASATSEVLNATVVYGNTANVEDKKVAAFDMLIPLVQEGLLYTGTTIGDGPGALVGGIVGGVLPFIVPESWQESIGGDVLTVIDPAADGNLETDAASVYAPDIYIYSKDPEQVHVVLGNPGALTESDPGYPAGGWTAGTITTGSLVVGGREYGYLQYEALVMAPWQTTAGWDVTGGRAGFLAWAGRTLPGMGLNARETSDFIAYWSRHLPAAPYYLVAPQPEQAVDRAMPLTVTPRPDGVLRLWLYVVPLQSSPAGKMAPVSGTPARPRGNLVVVEWGVVLG